MILLHAGDWLFFFESRDGFGRILSQVSQHLLRSWHFLVLHSLCHHLGCVDVVLGVGSRTTDFEVRIWCDELGMVECGAMNFLTLAIHDSGQPQTNTKTSHMSYDTEYEGVPACIVWLTTKQMLTVETE